MKKKTYWFIALFIFAYCTSPTEKSDSFNEAAEESERENSPKAEEDDTSSEDKKPNVEYEPYYRGLEQLTGEALAEGLYQRIKGHKTVTYRQSYYI